MASKALPSPEVLRQLLRYEPETGKLFWRERGPEWFPTYKAYRVWNGRYAGREAFTARRQGYLCGNLLDQTMQAHRVIWAIVTGAWPSVEIDHEDGKRDDNRFTRLREATSGENGKNKALRSDNKSGKPGVSYRSDIGKWHARITVNRKTFLLGDFASLSDAIAARAAAEPIFGFHKNHGRKPA